MSDNELFEILNNLAKNNQHRGAGNVLTILAHSVKAGTDDEFAEFCIPFGRKMLPDILGGLLAELDVMERDFELARLRGMRKD